MKNLKILLILSLTITLFSCKSDDSVVVASANADLLGTWTMTALTGTIAGNKVDSSDNTTTAFTATNTGKDFSLTLTFTESPNNLTQQGTYSTDTVITEAGGNVETANETGETLLDDNPATWARNGGTLTVTDEGVSTNYSITINGNTMTVVWPGTFNKVEGTVTASGTSTDTITFTKQ